MDAERNVSVSVTPVPTPARRMVAEFMVLANRLMGERLRDNGVPAIYRTQEPVSLEDVPDTSVDAVRHYHILRQIRPSRLSTTPGRHALIGVEPYVQATSPLRRYLDLAVQRQLASAIDGTEAPYTAEDLRGSSVKPTPRCVTSTARRTSAALLDAQAPRRSHRRSNPRRRVGRSRAAERGRT